jgi:hypothetical protein
MHHANLLSLLDGVIPGASVHSSMKSEVEERLLH